MIWSAQTIFNILGICALIGTAGAIIYVNFSNVKKKTDVQEDAEITKRKQEIVDVYKELSEAKEKEITKVKQTLAEHEQKILQQQNQLTKQSEQIKAMVPFTELRDLGVSWYTAVMTELAEIKGHVKAIPLNTTAEVTTTKTDGLDTVSSVKIQSK